MIPSFHSAGILPVDQTLAKSLQNASLIGPSAALRSSGVMPSEPAALPFFRIALTISVVVGMSASISGSVGAARARLFSSSLGVEGGWLRAAA